MMDPWTISESRNPPPGMAESSSEPNSDTEVAGAGSTPTSALPPPATIFGRFPGRNFLIGPLPL